MHVTEAVGSRKRSPDVLLGLPHLPLHRSQQQKQQELEPIIPLGYHQRFPSTLSIMRKRMKDGILMIKAKLGRLQEELFSLEGSQKPTEDLEDPQESTVFESLNECCHVDREVVPFPDLFLEQYQSTLNRSNIMPSISNSESPATRMPKLVLDATKQISQMTPTVCDASTIIRKPIARSRPKVRGFMHSGASEIGYAQDTPPSTPTTSDNNTSSTSRYSSTPPTPDSTAFLPRYVARHSLGNVGEHERDSGQTGSSDLRCADPLGHITIRTIEATTNAKIFLETYFNNLFRELQPRTSRRRDLEGRLYFLDLPQPIQYLARRKLEFYESQRLRMNRVLRSRDFKCKDYSFDTSSYDNVKVLGKGSFGVVRLIRERDHHNTVSGSKGTQLMCKRQTLSDSDVCSTHHEGAICEGIHRWQRHAGQKVFAMKAIRKSDMLRHSQEGHLKAERDLLVSAEGSEWIIPLFAAFQDDSYLYLVMEFCIGGDFMGLLCRKTILPEHATRWYIAEMILCIEETHRLNWIHRDVKPDNFLIGADGHLKISDFGLAFDGEWQHDQRYIHKQRHSLIQKLGLDLQGDERDQQEIQTQDINQRIANLALQIPAPARYNQPGVVDVPGAGEKIVDWRNRFQRRKLARSIVGTSQYMAPEIIRGELYDGRCD